ncbi:hypothetical protein RND71_023946 [Anisodus tanguticus]|uniref:Uncharacterized protein n=1 Tax=Anisodus tanguticus TaxID=243964 RepID=A0AAE1RUV7_9SOLA|nr:hypothetical protein RND71_023946 [Anisodus tanguticus]
MDFPEINIISDFEAGVKCLQNPSLISRFFSLEKVPQVYHFWKWGALILAILATFSSLIRKINLLFIYIRRIKPSAEPLLQYLGEDFDISDDDVDDDGKCSLSEDSDDEDSLDQGENRNFTVAGSSFYFREKEGQNRNLRLRRRRNSLERFPWTGFSAGKNVVKLWDSLALGLDYEYEDLSRSVVSLWDLNQEEKIGDLFSGSSKVPAVVLSSEVKNDRNDVVLAAYDTRMKSNSPAICADWGAGKVVGVNSSGVGKVYVRNEANGMLMVGDMRNVKAPLEKMTEADAVIDG